MKKLIVFLLLIGCLSATMLFKLDKNPLFEAQGVTKVCFVSDVKSENDGVNSVECGNLVFNFCSLQTAKENLEQLSQNTKSVQFYIEEIDVESILKLLKAEIVNEITIEDMNVVCAYSPYGDKCVYVENKKVNVQIATKEGNVIVGFPMILTGY